MNMKGRDHGKGPAEMVVCFPTRPHLCLIQKPICSPAIPLDLVTRGRHRRKNSHHFRNVSIRGGGNYGSSNLDRSEPSSPKVTCSGQIKVRPQPNSSENWRKVMEEFERVHDNRKQKTRLAWGEALRFLTCLRNLRLDFRCFGGIPESDVTSDDDDDDGDKIPEENDGNSRGVFSSDWYMIVKEDKDEDEEPEDYNLHKKEDKEEPHNSIHDGYESESVKVPPPNALLLMRCRSAPAKSWQQEEDKEEKRPPKCEEEGTKRVVVMTCGENFSRFSADVVKETWLVGGIRDILSRSTSCRRW